MIRCRRSRDRTLAGEGLGISQKLEETQGSFARRNERKHNVVSTIATACLRSSLRQDILPLPQAIAHVGAGNFKPARGWEIHPITDIEPIPSLPPTVKCWEI